VEYRLHQFVLILESLDKDEDIQAVFFSFFLGRRSKPPPPHDTDIDDFLAGTRESGVIRGSFVRFYSWPRTGSGETHVGSGCLFWKRRRKTGQAPSTFLNNWSSMMGEERRSHEATEVFILVGDAMPGLD
jgi:hypothetical protein